MAGRGIGEVLALGVGVALSPLAVIVVVGLLTADERTGRAWAFVGAWALSLAVACTAALLLAGQGDAAAGGSPATWTGIVKLVLALLLAGFAVRTWRGRGGERTAGPEAGRRIAALSTGRAAALAVLLAAVKPKNLLLSIAAGVSVAQLGAPPAAQAAGVGAFVLVGTVGPGLPLALRVLAPRRSARTLEDLRAWMLRESGTITAVLALVIAAKLLGDALAVLG